MMKKENRPHHYTAIEWANLNFYGNYCNFKNNLEEISDYFKEFQEHIHVTNFHLQNNKPSKRDSVELEKMKFNFQHSHGNILRQSTILSLYILLETELGEYCKTFKKHANHRIKLNDFKGDLLERFKAYSKKVIDIPFNFESNLWQYLIGLHEVRNCLVHNNSIIQNFGKRKNIEHFAEQNNLISIKDNYLIDITPNGCEDAIEKVDRFFVTITELAFDQFPGSYRLQKATEFELPILK